MIETVTIKIGYKMNYKGITIVGRHGLGYKLVHCSVVYEFNRLTTAKKFIDEVTA